MQNINAALQTICGINSIPYNGALGHRYFVNSLPQIIAQVMVLLRIHDCESHVGDRKWQIPKSDRIFIFIQRIVIQGLKKLDRAFGGCMNFPLIRPHPWLKLMRMTTSSTSPPCCAVVNAAFQSSTLCAMVLCLQSVGSLRL